MGLWWKNDNATPPEDAERKVSYNGDPQALSKRYPILWRQRQNWQLLRVASSVPYWLHFQSANGRCMQYRKLIHTEFVAVRIGPEAATFWAVDAHREPLKIADMRIMFPAQLRRDSRDMWQRQDAQRFENQTEFV